MRIKHFTLLFVFIFIAGFTSDNFKKIQLKYPHVKTAYKEKWEVVKEKLTKAGVDTNGFEIFIRVFKLGSKLEVWAKSANISQFKLVETYPICESSGELGPKRKQGDGQVPEGFYEVSAFNPMSDYFLGLEISYPNKSDLIKGDKADPGGEIMIHGNCVTIGCMPLTDDKIKEVYIMAVEARNDGEQNIPVHVFPTQLNTHGLERLKTLSNDETKIKFWTNLQAGYNYFETKKVLPKISIDKNGDYVLL